MRDSRIESEARVLTDKAFLFVFSGTEALFALSAYFTPRGGGVEWKLFGPHVFVSVKLRICNDRHL